MSPRIVPRGIGVLLVLGGAWGLLTTQFLAQFPALAGMNDDRLVPLALLVSSANVMAGLALFFRPYLGFAVALVAQAPQAISFAVGSVAYSLNLWPNYRIEFIFPGLDLRDAHASVYAFTTTPDWLLRTGKCQFGLGIGIDLVSTGVVAVLLIGLWAYRRAIQAPGQSSKPAPRRDAA